MISLRRTTRTAIDLFCGCGGLSLGLRRAGFRVIAAVDSDGLSISTYRLNHRPKLLIEQDIRRLQGRQLMDDLEIQPGELDLLAGCPPCQGFSVLRTLNGRHQIDDPMNDLVFEFLRFVRILRPKAIMMENVPRLLSDPRLAVLREALDAIGYKHDARVLNAVDFGVAQRRQRLILLGALSCSLSFAAPVNRRWTVGSVIRRVPPPQASSDPVHNYRVKRAKHVMSLIRRIPKDGGSRADLPTDEQLPCHKRCDGFSDIYGRMSLSEPAPTITGGCINPSKGRFLHPERNRAITLREAAMLQGFPRAYRFDTSRGRYPLAQVIGNAFPPKFAEHHARSILQQLDAAEGLTANRPCEW